MLALLYHRGLFSHCTQLEQFAKLPINDEAQRRTIHLNFHVQARAADAKEAQKTRVQVDVQSAVVARTLGWQPALGFLE
jgi:hypothetical protein